ncbi:gamma-butyrobetaine hydroxylase family protein [Alsobacter sp. R-9]
MSDHWPTEIKLSPDKRTLQVSFEGGETFSLPAEYLRVTSPSAEVQGHTPAERKTVPGKQEVQILAIDPVGHYAVRLRFDDLHDSGIYTWTYLHELGARHEEKWAAYLAELQEKGLSREPVRRR